MRKFELNSLVVNSDKKKYLDICCYFNSTTKETLEAIE